ncbi:MAG: DUF1569 domain-containing protein [Calditrichia bacterium]
MKDMFSTATIIEITERIQQLTPEHSSEWGKMNAAQMLRHCSESIEITYGARQAKQRLIGKLLGRFILKKSIKDNSPIAKNIATHPDYVVTRTNGFATEKSRLIKLLEKYPQQKADDISGRKHPFFGSMNADEWSKLNYKHFDHHLRQFGV